MARKPESRKRGTSARSTPEPSRAGAGGGIPTKGEILAFLQTAEGKIGKREIARAFGLRGGDRIALKERLAEMAEEGLIAGTRKRLRRPGSLPPVTVLEITSRDGDGEFVAAPVKWDSEEDGPLPRVLVSSHPPRKSQGPVPGVGDRILARITALAEPDPEGYTHEARPIKRLPRERQRLLGIFRSRFGSGSESGGGGVIDPVDRKQLREWPVEKGEEDGAEDGDLVRFDLTRHGRYGVRRAKVLESLGNPDDQCQVSLIAIHAHGIPDVFPPPVLAELEALKPPDVAGRTDLTDLPLVTIDPQDARDHDDAVWAAPDDDPANPGGHIVIVAIADVAHYVRPGAALDREAEKRGNSVYFPDRVVPMLPERISNDLCSLRERERRPCIAVRMVLDAEGRRKHHRFMRAMMRSAARLTYGQAQAAIDGRPDEATGALLGTVLKPLWRAWKALEIARQRHPPLALDLPERKILVGEDGRVARITVPPRLDAHRLIEAFMIEANVAAAESLDAKRQPLIYRIHEPPSREKLEALRDVLEEWELSLPRAAGTLRPSHFNTILDRVRSTPQAELVNEMVLRVQSQARYSPHNVGHFGLSLKRYAHFTSPIRRYADLTVHRALIRTLGLGKGGTEEHEADRLETIAEEISTAERRAVAAERETADRLIAYYLADRVGAVFQGRISGAVRPGLFIRLDETGADGFVPAATIGVDYFIFDEVRRAMIGERTGETYRLGDAAEVRLVEAIPTAGALRFEILSPGRPGAPPLRRRPPRPHRSGPPRRRGRH